MMGMLMPRVNTTGVVAGLVAGLLTFAVIRLLIPNLDAESLVRLGPWAGLKDNTWWDAMFTSIPALVVGIPVSLVTPAPSERQLKNLVMVGRHRPQETQTSSPIAPRS